MDERRQITAKTVIIILSVLLAMSVLALAGVLLYRLFHNPAHASAVIPGNIIVEETISSSAARGQVLQKNESILGMSLLTATQTSSVLVESSQESSTMPAEVSSALTIHKKNPEQALPFFVENMFPGDSISKVYVVQVAHRGNVVLRFHASVLPAHEKLAEVLQCRVKLLQSGQVLYDGLMRDMPPALVLPLSASQSTISEIPYEITAYLSTEIGNAYQNKELRADFTWWIEQTDQLEPPKTGDSTRIVLWISLAVICLFVLILLFVLKKRKRKEENDAG